MNLKLIRPLAFFILFFFSFETIAQAYSIQAGNRVLVNIEDQKTRTLQTSSKPNFKPETKPESFPTLKGCFAEVPSG